MKDAVFEWIKMIVFYQLLVSIVVNMIPDTPYQKYIRFFLGLLFLLLVIRPVFRILNLSGQIDTRYMQEMWEKELEENSLEIDMGEWRQSDGEKENPKTGNEKG